MKAREIIDRLELEPHPEGGHFREMFRDPHLVDGRSAGTAIYYLLAEGEISRWHRVDASEIWHFYAGASLDLKMTSAKGEAIEEFVLGSDLPEGERPQIVVPAHWWQSAQSTGAWSLVGCTVSPGFEFRGFEMAESGWSP